MNKNGEARSFEGSLGGCFSAVKIIKGYLVSQKKLERQTLLP
jgi:hypothetical protein